MDEDELNRWIGENFFGATYKKDDTGWYEEDTSDDCVFKDLVPCFFSLNWDKVERHLALMNINVVTAVIPSLDSKSVKYNIDLESAYTDDYIGSALYCETKKEANYKAFSSGFKEIKRRWSTFKNRDKFEIV